MQELKINKGPLPDHIKRGHRASYEFEKMEVGDWVYAEDLASSDRIQNAASAYGKRAANGFKLSRTKDPEGANGYYLERVK